MAPSRRMSGLGQVTPVDETVPRAGSVAPEPALSFHYYRRPSSASSRRRSDGISSDRPAPPRSRGASSALR
ncbi:hypothetical protein RU07_19065 [Agrobacterium tumefaciens]|uniref:Uncharacterized protein n=1 Tax=Agrobacterium tumefaciens TaxID=358 RepID=A0A0D0JTK8_AGRTU|nr:hypothetical protein RU07_19065 [Agrobacterium tumefaciens]